MILQEHVEGQPKPAFREAARAGVAGGAGLCKEFRRRLILIEILRDGRGGAQGSDDGYDGNNKKAAACFR